MGLKKRGSVAPVFFLKIFWFVYGWENRVKRIWCYDLPLRKQLVHTGPATLCLLRAAGSVPAFLELLWGRGETERMWGGGRSEEASLGEDILCFPLLVPLDISSSASGGLIWMSWVAASVKLKLSQPNGWMKLSLSGRVSELIWWLNYCEIQNQESNFISKQSRWAFLTCFSTRWGWWKRSVKTWNKSLGSL